jgi:Xaa-Pro aminopeptidase
VFCTGGTKQIISNLLQCHNQQLRWFGQPAAQTHPHLLQEGHVTPGISAEEYRTRRQGLIELIAQTNRITQNGGILVIIPSAPKMYMTYDIPYPFRQNTNFSYLCGFLEPDSVLVLESRNGTDHTATLYVPKRDPYRERWDGPRSGVDGAVYLTGVDAAYNNDDLRNHLQKFIADSHLTSVWYDSKKPAHPDFHTRYFTRFLSELNGKTIQSPQTLVQSLRLIKSPAEVELMKQTCRIASRSFQEVMKFSRPGVSLLY